MTPPSMLDIAFLSKLSDHYVGRNFVFLTDALINAIQHLLVAPDDSLMSLFHHGLQASCVHPFSTRVGVLYFHKASIVTYHLAASFRVLVPLYETIDNA
jgi:hypothetical protein